MGGAVRNPLMGLPLSDIDVCGPSLPDAVCKALLGKHVPQPFGDQILSVAFDRQNCDGLLAEAGRFQRGDR